VTSSNGSSADADDHLGAATRPPVPVLVVDDNAAKRLALTSVLAPLGYAIVEADGGLAALRCVAAQDFAVILLDVNMPDIDCFETAALVRQRKQSEMTPIIFITAAAEDEIQTDHYVEGAVDFIFAPVAPEELRAKVSVFAKLFRQAEGLAERAREVQATADQLRFLTDAAPIGIFQTDAQNRYVYTNPHWSEMTGISAAEALGQSWDVIFESERLTSIDDLPVGTMAQTEFGHRFEIQFRDSPSRVVLITSKTIPGARGGIAGWVGILADVTAEVGEEEAQSDVLDQLTALSRLDPLTGLGNRRALEDDLAVLEAQVARYGHRYCIALFDVDHFKAYNDMYGHQAGDEILSAVAANLTHQARGGDSVYRYGGEEFLCVFPEQSLDSGTTAVERMRLSIEKLAIPHAASDTGILTVSAGLAVLDVEMSSSASAVLKEADKALYRAKEGGRNRVEHAALLSA